MMSVRWRNGILAWVVDAGLATVGLTIVLLHAFDRQIIEQSGAKNLHAEFLQATTAVSRIISKSGDIHNSFNSIFNGRYSLCNDVIDLYNELKLMVSFWPARVGS